MAMLIAAARAQAPDDPGWFEALDENGDGQVDREEYAKALRQGAWGELHDLADEAFNIADLSGDGSLSPIEVEYFVNLANMLDRAPAVGGDPFDMRGAARLHLKYDSDADGRIGPEEYEQAVRDTLFDLGWLRSAWEDPYFLAWVKTGFRRADITGDGHLDPREFQFSAFQVVHMAVQSLASAFFRDFDADHDQRIQLGEVAEAAATSSPRRSGTSGAHDRTVAEAVLDAFPTADADGNGSLDVDEAAGLARCLLRTGRLVYESAKGAVFALPRGLELL